MLGKVRGERVRARARPVAPSTAPAELHPMIAVKLWQNPCWLSFRANYIAHHYNQPLYDWIWRTYKLTAPEHVVLYALGLRQGITADEIAASSARPKNTLSRAVNALLARRLLTRVEDGKDRRRKRLYLTRGGQKIVSETVPLFVRHERAMVAGLSADEQRRLNELLTKLVLGRKAWPGTIDKEETS